MDFEKEIDDLVDYLYNDESNFNNADTTSGQRCLERWEIEEALFKVLQERSIN